MTDAEIISFWFAWFYRNSDFGPADGDVRSYLADQFEDETGLTLPAQIREAL